jgi:L-lysine exporter family protein LysE/ArgO
LSHFELESAREKIYDVGMYFPLRALLEGFLTGAALIIAIGAQNAFVFKQGLKKDHLFTTALFCTLADGLLISIGVGGLGEIFTSNRYLLLVAKWGGALFLFWYGLRSFRAISLAESLRVNDVNRSSAQSIRKLLLTLAALSFLNPHVYLDTVVLLGTIGSQFDLSQRPFFAFGAIFASASWFFGLCYGSRLLAPFLKSPRAWQVIDLCIGCIMWGISFSLFYGIFST